ncbi:hypothetical protein EDF71_1335 [Comamonas sp. JUb58]|nr:hypothetical protein EDF71_1335 [Comamonas sp. JUb58]
MTAKKKIAAALNQALAEKMAMSDSLYAEELADFEAGLKASLDKDADDALLCMLADQGDVAMMLIDGDGKIYQNEAALAKLKRMWAAAFDANMQLLVPLLSDHISDGDLGVAGIKWVKSGQDCIGPNTSHIRLTGQAPRCFATKPNFTSTPSRSRPRLFSGCRAPS